MDAAFLRRVSTADKDDRIEMLHQCEHVTQIRDFNPREVKHFIVNPFVKI